MKLFIFNIIFLSFIFSSTFKNVQILEIEPRNEMIKYMKSISKDLGVRCDHCHVDDKSIDTPSKEIAREMIKLTRYLNNLLNEEFVDTTKNYKTFVTCWTCHHGKVEPEHIRPQGN